MSEKVSVHVWSDVVCPWCYIGRRRFERAVAQTGIEVEVEYHSFRLSPDTPADFDGSEVDFLVQHKGMPADDVRGMLAHVTDLAAAEGLTFDFDAARPADTDLAHQALHHAKAEGRQGELVERLFRAHFEQGRHVGRVDELVALGEEAGLDGAALRAALTEGRYAEHVQQDIDAARRLGIQGVPFYVIDERYGVSGAQSAEVFAGALRRVVEERAAR